MTRFDVSTSTLDLQDEERFAEWAMTSTTVEESKTTAQITVRENSEDLEYLDLTPIFQILAETHTDAVTDSFYLREVSFSPSQQRAVLTITTDESVWSGDGNVTEQSRSIVQDRELQLCSEQLHAVDYEDPPLLVG